MLCDHCRGGSQRLARLALVEPSPGAILSFSSRTPSPVPILILKFAIKLRGEQRALQFCPSVYRSLEVSLSDKIIVWWRDAVGSNEVQIISLVDVELVKFHQRN